MSISIRSLFGFSELRTQRMMEISDTYDRDFHFETENMRRRNIYCFSVASSSTSTFPEEVVFPHD